LGLAAAEYWRDRAHLRVSVNVGRLSDGGEWSEPVLFVEAVNAGRRQIEVVSAGLSLESGTDRLFLTGNPGYYKTPAILQEGETHKTWTAVANVADEVIKLGQGLPSRAYYRDSLGREHWTSISAETRASIESAIRKLGDARKDV
jgi:hypothetical protein